MSSLEQLLTNAVLDFTSIEIDACKRALLQYYSRRNRGEEQPVTLKNKVQGDKIAEALLTLINSRMYPYLVDEDNKPEDCQHCGE